MHGDTASVVYCSSQLFGVNANEYAFCSGTYNETNTIATLNAVPIKQLMQTRVH